MNENTSSLLLKIESMRTGKPITALPPSLRSLSENCPHNRQMNKNKRINKQTGKKEEKKRKEEDN